MEKEIEKLANEISFRLLETKDHPDYEWLKEKLKEWNFQHFVMVRLMCELGGRMGEVLPLLIQDYNPGTKTIDINKTVNTATNELHHITKTKAGMRTVALSDEMANLIEKLI